MCKFKIYEYVLDEVVMSEALDLVEAKVVNFRNLMVITNIMC